MATPYEAGMEFAHGDDEVLTADEAARASYPNNPEAQREFRMGYGDECELDWLRRQNG